MPLLAQPSRNLSSPAASRARLTFNFEETAGVKNDITALNLCYRAGKLDVGFAHQDQKNTVAASDCGHSVLSAAYNLGVAHVSAQFQNSKQATGLKDNRFVPGVLVPVATNTDVSLP